MPLISILDLLQNQPAPSVRITTFISELKRKQARLTEVRADEDSGLETWWLLKDMALLSERERDREREREREREME